MNERTNRWIYYAYKTSATVNKC